MFRFASIAALVAVFAFASSAKSCPPVAVSNVQVQAGCFAPSVAVQAYAVPQAVVVQQHAFAVQAVAVPAVKVQVQRRFFGGRLFAPRARVSVRVH